MWKEAVAAEIVDMNNLIHAPAVIRTLCSDVVCQICGGGVTAL